MINSIICTLDVQCNGNTALTSAESRRSALDESPKCQVTGAGSAKTLLMSTEEVTGLYKISQAILDHAFKDLTQDTE